MTTLTGVRRASPPQAIQKVRENYFLIQIQLSESPSADWRRLFYDAQQDTPLDFPPRSLEITGALLRFRSGPESVAQKIEWVDRWIEKANQKEASLGVRSEEQRRHREEAEREKKELEEFNSRWSKL